MIDARLPTVPVTYRLKDLADEAIKGKFYESEIQKVVKDVKDYFDVEKILKTRRRGGRIGVSEQVQFVDGHLAAETSMSRFHLTLAARWTIIRKTLSLDSRRNYPTTSIWTENVVCAP